MAKLGGEESPFWTSLSNQRDTTLTRENIKKETNMFWFNSTT